jgi:hypothetical protein
LIPCLETLATVTIVGVDEFKDGAILDKDGLEQKQRLNHHVHAGPILEVIETGVELFVGCGGDDAVELQPLRGEAIAEALRLWADQHKEQRREKERKRERLSIHLYKEMTNCPPGQKPSGLRDVASC